MERADLLAMPRAVLALLREVSNTARTNDPRLPGLLARLRPASAGPGATAAGQLSAAWRQAFALAPTSREAAELCVDLALSAPDHLPFLLGPTGWRSWLDGAIDLAASLGRRENLSRLAAARSNLRLSSGDVEGGSADAAASLAAAQEPESIARSLALVGMAAADRGELEQAKAHFTKALEIASGPPYLQLRADLLGNLGTLYSDSGEIDRSSACHEEALTVARGIGDLRGEGRHLGNLAILEKRRGHLDRAEACYRDQIKVARRLKDERQEALALYNLGLTFNAAERDDDAEDCFKRALRIRGRLGDRGGVFGALNALGVLYKNRGRTATARKIQEHCLKIALSLNDRERQASVLANLGHLQVEDDLPGAERSFRESERLAAEVGNVWSQGIAANGLAIVAQAEGDLPRAIEHLERALRFHRLGGELSHLATGHLNLARLTADNGEEERALCSYREAIAVFQSLGNAQGLWRVVHGLCTWAETQGALDRCRGRIEEALQALEAIGDPEVEGVRQSTGLSRLESPAPIDP